MKVAYLAGRLMGRNTKLHADPLCRHMGGFGRSSGDMPVTAVPVAGKYAKVGWCSACEGWTPPTDDGWRRHAACTDTEPGLMFPEEVYRGTDAGLRRKGAKERYRAALDEARKVCEVCPVRHPCLSFALSLPQSDDMAGVWGGMSVGERASMRRMLGEGAA